MHGQHMNKEEWQHIMMMILTKCQGCIFSSWHKYLIVAFCIIIVIRLVKDTAGIIE